MSVGQFADSNMTVAVLAAPVTDLDVTIERSQEVDQSADREPG